MDVLSVAETVLDTEQESRVETAHDWMQRSRRKRAVSGVATDPSSAAWNFFREGGTGINFMDNILRRQGNMDQLPVIDIRGNVGKTSTLVSLAARFAVATRPSQFSPSNIRTRNTIIPQVIILDTIHDIVTQKLVYAVRASLLRQLANGDEDIFDEDMECCLRRIHLASADDPFSWIPVLECLRYELAPLSDDSPTLLVWDGFLDDAEDDSSRMEIIRQLTRLLECCSVVLVTASSAPRKHDWNKHVTHRVRLDRNEGELRATVNGAQVQFSVTSSGVR